MITRCQFAIYALHTEQEDEVLETALSEISALEIEIRTGEMSSEIEAETDRVFAALQAAYQSAAEEDEVVMTATFSNAC